MLYLSFVPLKLVNPDPQRAPPITNTETAVYAVLYAFTPEVFPTQDRGTGNALTATSNRIFGIFAPVIAIYGDLATSVPVYVSGALFLVAGAIVLTLPFESRGKASL